MSGFDALGPLTCCSESTDRLQWSGSDATSLKGHKQARSGNVSLWSTAQLQSATQHDRHCVTDGGRTLSWTSCLHSRTVDALISTSFDCTFLCGMALASAKADAHITDSLVYLLSLQTASLQVNTNYWYLV